MKNSLIGVAISLGLAQAAQTAGAWAVSTVGKQAYSSITGLSGITWAGGNQFYLVNDDGYIQPATLYIDLTNGKITNQTFGTAIQIGGDTEGIAYNPARGTVFVSNETGPAIKEYYPNSTFPVGGLTLPSVFNYCRSNKSLESLTMSGDGLTLWTANEEALTCDGAIASTSSGTTVRLTKYTRPDLNTTTWTLAGQWAYKTDKFSGSDFSDKACHGVSDLCALPDGTLLVLERDCSIQGIGQYINVKVYAVPPTEFSAAKDISTVSALTNASYTVVSKGNVLLNEDTSEAVYEGICLGPRLADGSTSLILVSDGDVSTVAGFTITWEKKFYGLKLTGGSIVSLDRSSTSNGVAYPPGGPYRYMSGANVAVSVSVPGPTYSNFYSCTGCSLSGGTTGTYGGSSVTFPITGDHTVCTWNWLVTSMTAFPLNDSFEGYAVGQAMNNVCGWTGGGVIKAETYTPATPPGYPMPNVAHTRVLASDDSASREINAALSQNLHIDFMAKPGRQTDPLAHSDEDIHCSFSVDSNGYVNVWHMMSTGTRCWTPLSKQVMSTGAWVRVSVTMDFTSSPAGHAMFQPRLNGSLCPTANGFRAPDDLRSPGSWYFCADDPALGGGGTKRVSGLQMVGIGSIDDLVVEDESVAFLNTGATSTNDIPFVWFDNNGLSRDPDDDLDQDGHSAYNEYVAGTDPNDAESFFKVLSIWHEDGLTVVQFPGGNDTAKYVMKICTNLADKVWTAVSGTITQANGTNTWRGSIDTNAPCIFYRPSASL